MPLDLSLTVVLGAVLALVSVLVLALWLVRRRSGARRTPSQTRAGRTGGDEAVDTVTGWPPKAARVLTSTEREALEVLRRALPHCVVLAQVPLSRFIRVPARRSQSEWLQRVGYLSADLLLCDSSSQVLAAIDVRSSQESERSRARHDRMARVLRAADIEVHVWNEGNLPSVSQVRALFRAHLSDDDRAATGITPARESSGAAPQRQEAAGENATARSTARVAAPSGRPREPDISELLAEGDAIAARNPSLEPVPSSFFDELDRLPPVKSRTY